MSYRPKAFGAKLPTGAVKAKPSCVGSANAAHRGQRGLEVGAHHAQVGQAAFGAGEAEAAWLLHPLPATRADLLSTPHAPATEWLPHEGLRYRLHSRHHTAVRVATAATTAGDAGPSLSLLCYRGPGAHRLLVTRWADEPSARLYAGERVLGEALIVLAGS